MFTSMLPFEEKKSKKCCWHLDGDGRIDIYGGHGGHILQIVIQRQLQLFQEALFHFCYPVKDLLVYSLTYTRPTCSYCYRLIKSRGDRRSLSILHILLFIWFWPLNMCSCWGCFVTAHIRCLLIVTCAIYISVCIGHFATLRSAVSLHLLKAIPFMNCYAIRLI